MPDGRDHAAVIFAAIIPGRKDLLDRALSELRPVHFEDPAQRSFFQFIEGYAERTGGVLNERALESILRKADAGKKALYAEVFNTAFSATVGDDEFAWSVFQLKDLAAEVATEHALARSMDILRRGVEDEAGVHREGHEDARAALLEALSVIDQDLLAQAAPEGTIQDEEQELLREYEQRKQDFESGAAQGVRFGLLDLDSKVGGLQAGDLVLVAGYASDGKSSMMVQLAWSASVEQGKNVLLFTTETVREVMRRKIIARHSKLPVFGYPDGLNTRDLKSGRLSPREEQVHRLVVADLTHNPNYGKLHIAQVPRGASIASLEQRAMSIQRNMHIDLIEVDYLALLSSDARRMTDRESLSGIVKAAKVWATTFDNGRGVPVVSPWQVNRASREMALREGHYSSAALAETAEATNSSDVIISLLAPADNTNRHAEVTCQVLKNRDGETASNLLLDVDYATSAFVSKASVSFDMFATAAGSDGLDGLV